VRLRQRAANIESCPFVCCRSFASTMTFRSAKFNEIVKNRLPSMETTNNQRLSAARVPTDRVRLVKQHPRSIGLPSSTRSSIAAGVVTAMRSEIPSTSNILVVVTAVEFVFNLRAALHLRSPRMWQEAAASDPAIHRAQLQHQPLYQLSTDGMRQMTFSGSVGDATVMKMHIF
jgi:hypothetical protein